MTDPTIRKATLEDVPQIVACIDAAYAPYIKTIANLPPVSESIDLDVVDNLVWVVEDDGAIAGVVVCVEQTQPRAMKLANLAVHPSQGGKGLGGKLIRHAEQSARELGYVEMQLNTHKDMTDTQRLYFRLGWQELARDGATVTMKKSLFSD